jgi:hypothetical protein
MRVLRLIETSRHEDTLAIACAIDDLQFRIRVRYDDVDLDELARMHGDLVDRLAVHVALFQINTACCFLPDVLELGPSARFLTADVAAVWRTVFRHVWAQWRYEHDLPDYAGPAFADPFQPAPAPARVDDGDVELLVFSGGGKDSLVAAKLLERAGLPFATLGYAHSIYGDPVHQHALLDRVGAVTARVRAERQWIDDDLIAAPIARLRPALGVRYVLAAETPASVFAALPLALARGYRGLVVAHERSANAPNLVWSRTGEAINHQWGKSWDAEQLLDAYIRQHLLANVRYFSILQPVHDEVIFALLARDADLAPLTHSCNVTKPWCGRCAKCAYVWLQMAAHLPRAIVSATFGRDVGEDPANERHFRELLGLADHTPFECVGSAPEARLALARALARGWSGPRLAAYATAVGPIDTATLANTFRTVGERHGMPAHVAARVIPQLRIGDGLNS